MARFKMDYHAYRGRRTLTDVLRVVAVVLLVLVILAGAILIFGQRFIEYGDGGIRLNLPFLQQDEIQVPDPGDVSVVVRPQEQTDPVPPVGERPMGAVTVPFSSILDGTAEQLAREAGADAIVVDMKGDDGALNWVSSQAIARNVRANSETVGVNEQITEFNRETGLYTVARMSCFRDHLVGSDMGCAVLTADGSRWADDQGVRWSTPGNNTVRSYLAQAAAELAGLGFDEVLLDHIALPNRGDLSRIPEGVRTDYTPAAAFLAEAAAVMEPLDTVLSLRVDGEDLAALEPALALSDCCDRLWLTGEGQPALEGGPADTVAVVPALNADRQGPQAVLNMNKD